MSALTFPNGVTGVWDGYQDFYSGSSMMPAPIYPVLIPLNCSDIE